MLSATSPQGQKLVGYVRGEHGGVLAGVVVGRATSTISKPTNGMPRRARIKATASCGKTGNLRGTRGGREHRVEVRCTDHLATAFLTCISEFSTSGFDKSPDSNSLVGREVVRGRKLCDT
jgi:hypothetical protein